MKPDHFSRCGRASMPTPIVCTCDGAALRCLVCETERETELGCDVGLDGMRPMPAPVRTPEDYARHARIVRGLAAAAILIWLTVVALLRLCGARSLNP